MLEKLRPPKPNHKANKRKLKASNPNPKAKIVLAVNSRDKVCCVNIGRIGTIEGKLKRRTTQTLRQGWRE